MIGTDPGDVARDLFEFLERDRLAYCVLGDARSYPRAIASDVDIAVARESLAEVPETLARFSREHRVHLVQVIRHERSACYFVLAWGGPSGAPRFLAVDFCSDFLRKGRRFLTARELLEGRERAAGAGARLFYVPAPHVRFIYYLIKKIDKGELDEEHGSYLSGEWRLDPVGAWAWVRRFWPQAEDAELIAHAAAGGDWSAVRAVLPWFRRALRRAVPLSAGGIVGEVRRAIERILGPTGVVVAVAGPDGCGKSTVIERVLTDLEPAFRSTARVHLRPSLIARKDPGVPVTDPHAEPARGAVLSTVKLAYLLFDYLAGYALRVWPLKVRSTLVAFDRYYQDLLVDPARFRYGGSMRLARWAAKLVPHPDMWVVLDAGPEVLSARKAELPPAESARQRQEYLSVVGRFREAIVVDAARPLDQVALEVEWAVLRLLEQRLEDRYSDLREYKKNPLSARLLLFFCRHRVPVLSKLFRIVFNSDIYCRMRSPILIPHPYGIIIHGRSIIGSHVTVMQQVTIGSKDPGESVAPIIEDDVYIGAGARVLGGIRVGKGAVIGANAVVTHDVPPHATVVGANRIVRKGSHDDFRARARAARERLTAA